MTQSQVHSVTGTAVHVRARLRAAVIVESGKSNAQIKRKKKVLLGKQNKGKRLFGDQIIAYTQLSGLGMPS